jgi:hypothetical protein
MRWRFFSDTNYRLACYEVDDLGADWVGDDAARTIEVTAGATDDVVQAIYDHGGSDEVG